MREEGKGKKRLSDGCLGGGTVLALPIRLSFGARERVDRSARLHGAPAVARLSWWRRLRVKQGSASAPNGNPNGGCHRIHGTASHVTPESQELGKKRGRRRRRRFGLVCFGQSDAEFPLFLGGSVARSPWPPQPSSPSSGGILGEPRRLAVWQAGRPIATVARLTSEIRSEALLGLLGFVVLRIRVLPCPAVAASFFCQPRCCFVPVQAGSRFLIGFQLFQEGENFPRPYDLAQS